jgi:colanic acid/amylovoran biosynthesis protein
VVSTLLQLRERHPALPVTLLSHTPEYDAGCIDDPLVRVLKERLGGRWHRLPLSLARRGGALVPGLHSEVLSLRGSDLVLVTGGDLFSSDYGSIQPHLRPLELALDTDVPVAFIAQSIGPFESRREAAAWARVGRRARFVTVREQLSLRYVIDELGLPSNRVLLTADPAFLLPASSSTEVSRILQAAGVSADAPLVTVAPSRAIAKYAKIERLAHMAAWQATISLLIREFGAEVLLIPHSQALAPDFDDRQIVNALSRLAADPRVHLADESLSASQFKGLIGRSALVIAERMHAAIAGLSSEVCTVAVGYSFKARGIMSGLFGPSASAEGVLLSVQDFIRTDRREAALRAAWARREAIVGQLRTLLPAVRMSAASAFDLVEDLLVRTGRRSSDRTSSSAS